MAQRIIVRHLNGSKANQVEEFPTQHVREIIFGREPGVTVLFDPDRDDLVSRQHCRIAPDPSSPDAYILSDNNSRNGTFLNQRRIFGATRIAHSDVVQLGPGGPEFRFEMDPPPVAPRPTRLAPEPPTATYGRPAPPTRDASASGFPMGMTPPGMPPPTGSPDTRSRPVGRATVERMLGDVVRNVKGDSNRALVIGVISLAAILIIGAGVYAYMRKVSSDTEALAQSQQATQQQMGKLGEAIDSQTAKTAEAVQKAAEDARKAAEPAPKPEAGVFSGITRGVKRFLNISDASKVEQVAKVDPPPSTTLPPPPVAPAPVVAPAADPGEGNAPAAKLMALTSDEVYAKNLDAMVYIEASWKLIDTTTGRQVYQYYVPNDYTEIEHHFFGSSVRTLRHFPEYPGKNVPVYMQDENGIRPVLTNTDDGGRNKPIGGQPVGTGFVVSTDGLILSARDVVSPWESSYLWGGTDAPGLMVGPDGSFIGQVANTAQLPRDWMPASDTSSFWESISYDEKTKRLLPQVNRARPLEGRLDYLNVTFARTRQRTHAQLVRSSDQHDAALIKVSLGVPLTAVALNDNYNSIRVGEGVTVLGFAVTGPDTPLGTASRDASGKVIPDPSAAAGNVAKIFRNNGPIDGIDYLSGEFGDSYRLGVNGGGFGYSGAPVFDAHGQVIAIFYAGRSRFTLTSFAVPIRYGQELLTVAKVAP